jgi:Uma2 family endonuclease
LYEANGVQEYWIVWPVEQTVLINVLVNGQYVPSRLFTSGDILTSQVLSGFTLDLNDVFESIDHDV